MFCVSVRVRVYVCVCVCVCVCVHAAELLMIWQHRETMGGSNYSSLCVTHFIQRTYRQTSQHAVCWMRLGRALLVWLLPRTPQTLSVTLFLSLHPSWFIYLIAIWFHPSLSHTHTHTHTRWTFLHGQSQCCYRDAAHMMNRLWQHNFSIISLSRSSLYQHNSATFKWQLTVLLWCRGRPICVFQGRYRYRLLQIK